MLLPVPRSITRGISERAAQIAKQEIQRRGWRSSDAIQSAPEDGKVGLRTTAKYLMYQDQGTRPFIMHWVEGRRVPLGCPQGDGPHIRFGKGAGQPGWVNIPHRGRVWRQQKWRHPGIKPQRFLESAINQAISESRPQIQQMLMDVLQGKAPQQ